MLTFIASQGQSNHNFIINGKIKGYTGNIKLYKLKENNHEILIANSAVSKEGKFSFQVKDTNESCYYISFPNFPNVDNIIFINDGPLITVEMDWQGIQSIIKKYMDAGEKGRKVNVNADGKNFYTIKGSKATNELMNIGQFMSKQLKLEEGNRMTTLDFKKQVLMYYNNTSSPLVQGVIITLLSSFRAFTLAERKDLLEKSLVKYPHNPYLEDLKKKEGLYQH